MSIDRDKFLTEEMDECYHEGFRSHGCSDAIRCNKCGGDFYQNLDFSTWDSFGKLYEWSIMQTWWYDFFWNKLHNINPSYGRDFNYFNIKPDRFANLLYDYLRNINE